MAKKKVEVNEDMLKDIMVGDIPVFGRVNFRMVGIARY